MKHCIICNKEIPEDDVFCPYCEESQEAMDTAGNSRIVSPSPVYPKIQQPRVTPSVNRTHGIVSVIMQVICVSMMFLPTIRMESFVKVVDFSIIERAKFMDITVVFIILIAACLVAAAVMFTALTKGNYLVKGNIIFMQVMAVVSFLTNVIFYFVHKNYVTEKGYNLINVSLSPIGWAYVILSIIFIIDLFILSSQAEK